MTHAHFIERCVAGHVVNQCRCIGPKSERVLPGPCRCQTASTAPIAHVVATPPPAMPSEGERLEAEAEELRAGFELILAHARAAARLEALAQAADRLAELEPCRCNLAWTDRGLHDSDCRYDLHEEIRSLSAPPQKTQEEMTDG